MNLPQCIRRDKLDRNGMEVYLVEGWALRPCNKRENLDRNCRLGYLVEERVYAPLIGGRN